MKMTSHKLCELDAAKALSSVEFSHAFGGAGVSTPSSPSRIPVLGACPVDCVPGGLFVLTATPAGGGGGADGGNHFSLGFTRHTRGAVEWKLEASLLVAPTTSGGGSGPPNAGVVTMVCKIALEALLPEPVVEFITCSQNTHGSFVIIVLKSDDRSPLRVRVDRHVIALRVAQIGGGGVGAGLRPAAQPAPSFVLQLASDRIVCLWPRQMLERKRTKGDGNDAPEDGARPGSLGASFGCLASRLPFEKLVLGENFSIHISTNEPVITFSLWCEGFVAEHVRLAAASKLHKGTDGGMGTFKSVLISAAVGFSSIASDDFGGPDLSGRSNSPGNSAFDYALARDASTSPPRAPEGRGGCSFRVLTGDGAEARPRFAVALFPYALCTVHTTPLQGPYGSGHQLLLATFRSLDFPHVGILAPSTNSTGQFQCFQPSVDGLDPPLTFAKLEEPRCGHLDPSGRVAAIGTTRGRLHVMVLAAEADHSEPQLSVKAVTSATIPMHVLAEIVSVAVLKMDGAEGGGSPSGHASPRGPATTFLVQAVTIRGCVCLYRLSVSSSGTKIAIKPVGVAPLRIRNLAFQQPQSQLILLTAQGEGDGHNGGGLYDGGVFARSTSLDPKLHFTCGQSTAAANDHAWWVSSLHQQKATALTLSALHTQTTTTTTTTMNTSTTRSGIASQHVSGLHVHDAYAHLRFDPLACTGLSLRPCAPLIAAECEEENLDCVPSLSLVARELRDSNHEKYLIPPTDEGKRAPAAEKAPRPKVQWHDLSMEAPSTVYEPGTLDRSATAPPPSAAALAGAAAPRPVSQQAPTPQDSVTAQDDHFVHVRVLGKGAFGTVTLAQSRLRIDQFFAVKRVPKKGSADWPTSRSGGEWDAGADMDGVRTFFQEAVTAMAVPPHRNIVQYFGIYDSAQHHNIVMQLAAGGSLDNVMFPPYRKLTASLDESNMSSPHRLRAHMTAVQHHLPEDLLVSWLSQGLAGLQHLHQNGIVHRDVKAANIMVASEAFETEQNILWADFGVSAVDVKPQHRDGHTHSEHRPVTAARTVIGTMGFSAPEMLQYWGATTTAEYSAVCDVWGLAVIFYCYITGRGWGPQGGCVGAATAAAEIGLVCDGHLPKLSFLYALAKQFGVTCVNVDDDWSTELTQTLADIHALWPHATGRFSLRQQLARVGALPPALLQLLDTMMIVDFRTRPSATKALQHLLFGGPLLSLPRLVDRADWVAKATAQPAGGVTSPLFFTSTKTQICALAEPCHASLTCYEGSSAIPDDPTSCLLQMRLEECRYPPLAGSPTAASGTASDCERWVVASLCAGYSFEAVADRMLSIARAHIAVGKLLCDAAGCAAAEAALITSLVLPLRAESVLRRVCPSRLPSDVAAVWARHCHRHFWADTMAIPHRLLADQSFQGAACHFEVRRVAHLPHRLGAIFQRLEYGPFSKAFLAWLSLASFAATIHGGSQNVSSAIASATASLEDTAPTTIERFQRLILMRIIRVVDLFRLSLHKIHSHRSPDLTYAHGGLHLSNLYLPLPPSNFTDGQVAALAIPFVEVLAAVADLLLIGPPDIGTAMHHIEENNSRQPPSFFRSFFPVGEGDDDLMLLGPTTIPTLLADQDAEDLLESLETAGFIFESQCSREIFIRKIIEFSLQEYERC